MSDRIIKDLLDFTRSINGIDLVYYICNKIDENLILYNILKTIDTSYEISVSYYDDIKISFIITNIDSNICIDNCTNNMYGQPIKIESEKLSENSIVINLSKI